MSRGHGGLGEVGTRPAGRRVALPRTCSLAARRRHAPSRSSAAGQHGRARGPRLMFKPRDGANPRLGGIFQSGAARTLECSFHPNSRGSGFGSAPLRSPTKTHYDRHDTTTHEQVIRRAQLQVLLAGLFAGMTREADRSMKGL
jgi:hypothetical protein